MKIKRITEKILCVEDFYEDLQHIFSNVKELAFFERKSLNSGNGEQTEDFEDPILKKKITKILNLDDSKTELITFFRYCNNSLIKDISRIHNDYIKEPEKCWTFVIYLNPNIKESEEYGTHFWRHIGTDSDNIIDSKNKCDDLGETFNNLSEDQRIYNKWIKYKSIPYKPNLFVIFECDLWHSDSPGFGEAFDDSRIVQVGTLALYND